jgi:23S rRNA maturation-related 3'-5' exoribonuclease YhaM
MTGRNTDRREDKYGINQRRNRRQTTTRTGTGMTMEQLIRETRKEVYRTQKKEEAISNKNTEKKVPRKATQQQQIIPHEMERYLTSAVVQVNEGTLTARLPDFCSKIPSGSYRVKIIVRKNNKVSVRMTYRAEQQPPLQQPDLSTPASP